MEQKIKENKLKIQRVFNKKRIRKIPESVIKTIDPELVSFFNVNTPEDFILAEKMASEFETAKEEKSGKH